MWHYQMCQLWLLEHWGRTGMRCGDSLFMFPALYQISLWLCRSEGKNTFHDGRCLLAGTQSSDPGERINFSRFTKSILLREKFISVLATFFSFPFISFLPPLPFALWFLSTFLFFFFLISFPFQVLWFPIWFFQDRFSGVWGFKWLFRDLLSEIYCENYSVGF